MAIEQDVARLLTARKLRLAVAEATCGGLLSARITGVPGSSKFFDRGVIAYSKQSKRELLGLTDEQLTQYGSVSKETASAMATAIRNRSGVDIGLAESGIAGPVRGRSPKPVGTCFLAVSAEDAVFCEERIFPGDRDAVRAAIAQRALELVLQVIEEGHPRSS